MTLTQTKKSRNQKRNLKDLTITEEIISKEIDQIIIKAENITFKTKKEEDDKKRKNIFYDRI